MTAALPAADATRRRSLAVMKRRATGLLVVVALAFGVLVAFTNDEGLWGFARAAAEGSLVGGLADWFAVTALFRHPLGIPVPHTAIIRNRKDQFGATLGEFVQHNFLTPGVVVERLRSSKAVERAATWLTEPANATNVADQLADVIGTVLESRDERLPEAIHAEVRAWLLQAPAARWAGQALEVAIADGRHHEVMTALLRAGRTALEQHREPLKQRFEESSPWWLPGAVEDRIFARVVDGFATLLDRVIEDADHDLRRSIESRLRVLAERLQTDPQLQQRAAELLRELADREELRSWTSAMWDDVRGRLRRQAATPGSELRARIAEMVAGVGAQLASDVALQERAMHAIESGVGYVGDHYHREIAELVSGTIARWDPHETSDKLELLLGRDLQFIRINGTVVGALAGLAIHAAAMWSA